MWVPTPCRDSVTSKVWLIFFLWAYYHPEIAWRSLEMKEPSQKGAMAIETGHFESWNIWTQTNVTTLSASYQVTDFLNVVRYHGLFLCNSYLCRENKWGKRWRWQIKENKIARIAIWTSVAFIIHKLSIALKCWKLYIWHVSWLDSNNTLVIFIATHMVGLILN